MTKHAYLKLLLLASISFAATATEWKTSQLSHKNSLRGSAIYENTLWVSGSKNGVFRSADQGQTWIDVSVKSASDFDFRDIEVFDKNIAIVMSAGTGQLSRLYKTSNSGKSWKLLYTNPEPQGFFNAIDFWDHNNGLLLGDPVDGYYMIKKTTDGGKTWRRIKSSKMPATHKDEAAFAASGNTLIVAKNGMAWFTTGGFSARVYTSTDFGESWSVEQTPLHQANATSGGFALAINTKQQLFVVGGDYKNRQATYQNLATKINGHWIKPSNTTRGLRTSMSCFDNVCVTSGKLFSDISYDHGTTWQPLAGSGFYTTAAQNNIILGAGDNGRIGVLKLP